MVLAAGLDPKGDAHLSKVIEVCQTHAGKKGDLLIVLQDIQAMYGYVPKETLGIVSQALGAAPSEIYGVLTFYNRFHLHPRGKHTVRCCRGTACHFKRSEEVIESVRQHLGLENEDTTKDFQFSLEEVACLGACGIAPVMTIDEDTIGNLTIDKALEAIDRCRETHQENAEAAENKKESAS